MKYQLIKTYPGSPKLNTVINDEITTFGVSFAKNNLNSIENHSEFWQSVVEKDYEILEIRGYSGYYLLQKDGNFYYSYEDPTTILYGDKIGGNNAETYLNSKFKHYIHSVKRLSDGEIFTVGDIVKCEDCKGKITSLEIYDNDIYLTGIDDKMPFGYTLCNALDCFEIPQKCKQKLFTTEDGVDVFKNDCVYSVTLILFNINKNIAGFTVFNNCKIFSSKEKAEEYVLLNKPCLSINEINNYCNLSLSQLKDLVKSKI